MSRRPSLMRRVTWFAGTAVRSTPMARPPSAAHATSASAHAACVFERHNRTPPSSIAAAAVAIQNFTGLGHRVPAAIPAANDAAIQSAGSFIVSS